MNKIIQIGTEKYNVTSDDNYLDKMGDSFEPHMLQLYGELVDKNAIVADIGANIGLASIWFSKQVKKTYAFEPSPSTFKILKENLAVAGAENVVANNIGLGSKDEDLTITFAKTDRSGAFVSDITKLSEGHVTEKIQITTLDNFFQKNPEKPSFLKIDVEGYEMNVIRGAANFLSSCKPTVVIEMNAFCLNVLHRICLPDFIDEMKAVFPVLYAIDADNRKILNLHVYEEAYAAMYAHFVHSRFPNLVGGFDQSISKRLISLVSKNSRQIFSGQCGNKTMQFNLTGWSHEEPTHRWSEGNSCSMEFSIPENTGELSGILLEGFGYGSQRLNVELNENLIYKTTLTGTPQVLEIKIPNGAIKTGLNNLNLELPDAKRPDNGDKRQLGFALHKIHIK